MPILATTYLHSCITSPRTSDVDAIEQGQTIDQKRLLASRQLGALVGKAVQASLGLIGLSLLGLHLARYFGMLPALLASFLILATPGLSELVRLGRAEYLVGVWLTAWTIRFIERRANGFESPNFVGWFLLAGACSLSYASLILIAVPAVGISLWEWRSQGKSRRWTTKETVVLLFAVLIGSAVPLRNAFATGDPFFPWLTVLFEASQGTGSEARQKPSTGSMLRDAYRIPSETIAEQMQSAQREIDGDANTSAEIPTRLPSSPFRIANAIDGVSRLLWNSTAHGLLLIPLAIVGVCVWRYHLQGRIVLLPCVWFLGWCIAWWGYTPRWDRDWVGMLILLAWPAAQGVRWFMDRVHAMWLGVLGVVVLCWSVLVIPVWPMSDNRLLVAIEEIRSDDLRGATAPVREPKAGNGPDDVAADQRESSYVKALNGYLGSLRRTSEVNVLIVGELDDFDIIAKTITSDRFDSPDLGSVSGMDLQQCGRYLSERSVSHVVIVWSGVLAREKLTNVAKEQKYRRLIDELTVAGRLRRVEWEMNSSVAELFEVNTR
jgi:hypothetical protein